MTFYVSVDNGTKYLEEHREKPELGHHFFARPADYEHTMGIVKLANTVVTGVITGADGVDIVMVSTITASILQGEIFLKGAKEPLFAQLEEPERFYVAGSLVWDSMSKSLGILPDTLRTKPLNTFWNMKNE